MKVCHVCNGHTVDDARVFHRACKTLAKAGYEVHLFAVSPEAKEHVKEGVVIHPIPECGDRRERFSRTRKLAQMAAALKPDLFHVHEPDLLRPVLARAGSRPVIYDVHESFMDILNESPWIPRWVRPLARFAWDCWERRLVGRCAGIVVVTEPIAQRYRPIHDNVHVVANYPDLPDANVFPPVERDGKTCVMAGAINYSRGLPQIFEALAILKRRGTEVRLSLAGGAASDQYLTSVLNEAERQGIRKQVDYHGVLSKREALVLQQQADIGLIIYLPFGNCKVGLPNKLLECMALGLPVVYSDFPVYQEVAGSAQAGIAVDPTKPEEIANAIEHLIGNPDLARQMGEAGMHAVRERFNWNAERVKLLRLYSQLLRATDFKGALRGELHDEVLRRPT